MNWIICYYFSFTAKPLELNHKKIVIGRKEEKGSFDVRQSYCFMIDKEPVTCILKLHHFSSLLVSFRNCWEVRVYLGHSLTFICPENTFIL